MIDLIVICILITQIFIMLMLKIILDEVKKTQELFDNQLTINKLVTENIKNLRSIYGK